MRASTAAILIFLLTPTAFPQGKLVEVIEVRVVSLVHDLPALAF